MNTRKNITFILTTLGVVCAGSLAMAGDIDFLQQTENKLLTPMVFIMNSLSGNAGKAIIGLTVCASLLTFLLSKKKGIAVGMFVAALLMGVIFNDPMAVSEWAMNRSEAPSFVRTKQQLSSSNQLQDELSAKVATGEMTMEEAKYQLQLQQYKKDYSEYEKKLEAWKKEHGQ